MKMEDGALVEPRPVETASILGAGTMEIGIAVIVADAGLDLFDADPAVLERGGARIRQTYRGQVAKGRLSQAAAEEREGRIVTVGTVAGLEQSDLFIDAVFEDAEVETAVLADLDAVARPSAVLATNTSYLAIDRLAYATCRPEAMLIALQGADVPTVDRALV